MTEERRQIREAMRALCDKFDDDYWLHKENNHEFPHAFRKAVAAEGWLGITMPEEYGGAGLGVTEAALLMQTVAQSAGAISACSTFHINLFGPHPVLLYGTEEQKRTIIPRLISGEDMVAFGVTEPDAGLDTTRITTRA
ncbi:MAG TPA: acyl-CoA dehydrogenase family protein, partial [Paracoccus sp.]|nr:acyl-CoA dehydrogenase family protein [Paracoccus sp. (in: a-proteobacteria)]